ncbi:MAG: 4'-phosphopantetheinyl transferase [Granulosicoccus sp.]
MSHHTTNDSDAEGYRSCPINGLTFAPEWAGTNIYLKSQPVADHTHELYEEELAIIKTAAQLRRNTFSSGRSCARAVMLEAGLPTCALQRFNDGSVQWPEGLLGSLSHTNEWAVAAIAVTSMCEAKHIGIDLERIKPLEEGVINLIATPVEREELMAANSPVWHAMALFSLKESIYKCLARDFGHFIEFHDVEISHLASGRPQLRFCRKELAQRYAPELLELRMAITPWHVFTLAWLRAQG